MNSENKERLATVAVQVWQLLSEDEKADYFYTDGIIGFVEDIIGMLHIDIDLEEPGFIDSIVEQLY